MTNLSGANLNSGAAVGLQDEGRQSPSTFPRYPVYKDSGVEWLGEVPDHWVLTQIKYLALLNPKKSDFAGDMNQLCSFVPMEKLKTGVVQLDEERLIEEVIGGYTYFEDGDVLQAKVTPCFENKNVAIAQGLTNGIGLGSSEINVLRPCKGVSAEYLYYRVQEDSYMNFCTSSMIGAGGLRRVPTDVINNFKIAAPNLGEQTQIARFLDHETARIDALIEEQQRLIELLKEKRQAVISHAVTKGLDPTVPMKDSGVEWLGEVPAHWMIKKIKHVMKSLDQGWSPQCDNFPVTGEEKGVLKVGCVNGGVFNSAENKRLPGGLEFYPDLTIKEGDLLISRANTRELVGSAAVPSIDYPNLMISDKLYRIRFYREQADPRFVCFYLATSFARREIELSATGASASMLNIAQNTILDMPFPCPPISEQEQIRDHIVSETYKILELVNSAQILVELLLERRSALISAAVTGKIDVRNWQPTASAQAPEAEQEAV